MRQHAKNKKLNIIGIIPARGGSVDVHLKNIHELCGKPLVYYVIKAALASGYLRRVIVSTDHEEIARISKQYGAEVPFRRPADISGGDVPTHCVIQHAVRFIEKEENQKIDIAVTLQATTPLLSSNDIDSTVKKLIKDNVDSAITVKQVGEHPWWMVTMDKKGFIKPFLVQDLAGEITIRQNLDTLYIPNGAVYATKRAVLMNENRIIGKRCSAVIMPLDRSVDIDNLLDFKIAEAIIKEWHI